MTLRMLSLFSGIGGIDLAARWAGIETVAFCEIEQFCQKVLAKHWPDVPIFDDVKQLTTESLQRAGVERVDLVAGGFPCQDISTAGKGEGIEGARSGLWFEMLRVISELRPTWVVAENVPALRTCGIDTVTSGLEAEGYTVAPPMVVGAWAVGAPHRRNRVWIVAHASGSAGDSGTERTGRAARSDVSWRGAGTELVNPEGDGRARLENERPLEAALSIEALIGRADGMGDPERLGCERWGVAKDVACAAREGERDGSERQWLRDAVDSTGAVRELADPDSPGRREQRGGVSVRPEHTTPEYARPDRWPARPGERQHEWEAPRVIESRVGDSVDGLSRRVARDRTAKLKALGNAVVPQVIYPIFEAIARTEAA